MSRQLKLLPIASTDPGDDVGVALHLLRDALADEAKRINAEGAPAMQAGDYPMALAVEEYAKSRRRLKDALPLTGDESRPSASDLQGDQTNSDYRNTMLRPVMQ